jgi:hypothetical protein
MTALAVARHLQDTTGLSINKTIRALRPLQQITIDISGHEHTAADPLPIPSATSSPPPAPNGRHT